MRFGYSEECLEHDTGGRHPESPDRMLAIRRSLTRQHGVSFVEPDPVSVDEVEAVHDPDYVDSLREFCSDGGGEWDPDTVAVPETWNAALRSAGIARWAATQAVAGADGADAPFAIGRPPGHHARTDDAGGFCFINNIAIAAQFALDRDSERVAIVDWDVHHGDGTQELFYDREDVLFASIHEEGIFPGTGEVEETGAGPGDGTTMNVPLDAGAGDAEYVAVLDRVIVPAIERFDPDLVLVSAGFDAHRHDPISRMRVSTEGYGAMTERVRDATDRVDAGLGLVLEGGYGLDTLTDGVTMVHETFAGREPVEPDGTPDETVTDLIERIRTVHGLGSK